MRVAVFAALGTCPSVIAQRDASDRLPAGTPTTTKRTRTKPPPLPTDPASERKLLAVAGEGFRLRSTSHFLIAYDVPGTTLSQLYSRLEVTYYKVHRFCRVRDIPLRLEGGKLEVIFCDRSATYAAHARRVGLEPEGTYGFYSADDNRSVFYNIENAPGVVQLRDQVARARGTFEEMKRLLARRPSGAQQIRVPGAGGRPVTLTIAQANEQLRQRQRSLGKFERKLSCYVERLNQTVIQHEAAHHVLFAGGVHVRGGDNPMWLVEGLAMQFETPPPRPGQTATRVNHWRLGEFRQACEQGALVPLARLLSDNELFTKNVPKRAICYAQAWALVYNLNGRNPDRFADYVRALIARRPGVSVAADEEQRAFRRFFGPVDEKFVKRWEKHILSLPCRSEVMAP